MDVSLADIIKKKKIQKFQNRRQNRNARSPAKRPTPFKPSPKVNIKDARLKIIQKNRTKLVDARDKLAQIAKKTDARLKLQKLRKQNSKLDTASKQTQMVANGRFALSTNRSGQFSLSPKKDFFQQSGQLQRRIKNDYRLTGARNAPISRMPPLPDIGNRSATWDSSIHRNVRAIRKPQSIIPKDLQMKITVNQNVSANRNLIDQQIPMEMDDDDLHIPNMAYERPSYPPSNRRKSVRDFTPPLERRHDRPMGGWESEHHISRSDTIDLTDSIRSRLDCSPPHVRTMGILSAEAGGYSRSPPRSINRGRGQLPAPRPMQNYTMPQGFRIVVSNLQSNVTQEDIKELFEDVGELLESRLVRPGTAEVIFKTLIDAHKAVEVYHNRQLDGQPMKCLLVNPRQGNKPTAPAFKPTSSQMRAAYIPKRAKPIAEPDIEAFHAAMFMRR